MYALSKTAVSKDTAQTIISAHFGRQTKIAHYSELTDGMYNAAYKIELTNGQKSVLKVSPPDQVQVLRYEKDIMRVEGEVLRLLRAQTDVPVPELFVFDNSRRLLDNDYILMAYIPGVDLYKLRKQLTVADQRPIDFLIGQYLRQINAINGSHFGLFAQPEFQFSTWREAFDSMIVHILQDGHEAGVELPFLYDTIYTRLQTCYGVLDEVRQPVLVHWDLWDGNIFVDPETKKISGVLDCERALWGDPLMEVNFGAFGFNPELMEGYGLDLLSTPSAKTRRILYNIYLWLVMIIECTYRQYNTKDQENMTRLKFVQEMKLLESA